MLQQISLEKAQQIILQTVSSLSPEYVPLREVLGRILAEDLVAEHSLPPHAQSAVDGFALADGNALKDSCFEITARFKLGDFPDAELGPGEAAGIFTGGILPPGTRAVIPHERTTVAGNLLTVRETVKPGQNIKQMGEDFLFGELLLERGTRLDPGAIALLAACGIAQAPVYRKPKVAIISLGTNVIPYGQTPQPGQTRDSNTPLLEALITRDGGSVAASLLVPNSRPVEYSSKLSELWEQVDLLITTGATYTQGDSEVQAQMDLIGAKPLYWGVPVLPGSHSGAAHCGSRLFLSLSGNPASCAVGYHLFAAPAIRAMQGLDPAFRYVVARCVNGFPKKSGSRRFVRGHATFSQQGWEVTVLQGQKPSMIRSLLSCNALIDIPAQSAPINAGAKVSIILLNQ